MLSSGAFFEFNAVVMNVFQWSCVKHANAFGVNGGRVGANEGVLYLVFGWIFHDISSFRSVMGPRCFIFLVKLIVMVRTLVSSLDP